MRSVEAGERDWLDQWPKRFTPAHSCVPSPYAVASVVVYERSERSDTLRVLHPSGREVFEIWTVGCLLD